MSKPRTPDSTTMAMHKLTKSPKDGPPRSPPLVPESDPNSETAQPASSGGRGKSGSRGGRKPPARAAAPSARAKRPTSRQAKSSEPASVDTGDRPAASQPSAHTKTQAREAPTPAAEPAPSTAPFPTPSISTDIEALAGNVARLIEEGGKALSAYLKPREQGVLKTEQAEEVTDIVMTLGQVLEYWLSDPQRAARLQTDLGASYLALWAAAAKRMVGEPAEPVARPDARDKRFADAEWTTNQFFDFLKQAYLLTADWARRLVDNAEGLDPLTRQKAEFYIRQITNALAPPNFVLTNPELLRETLQSNAGNLVRGMHMLAEDIAAGGGNLKIRQSDPTMFEVGRNLALTPGKVIYQNELMQLIQYAPATETVLKRPLLIVPPWINKFYILDLVPEKSFIKWCVEQGITVFCISWVNPDAHLAQKGFEDYMREGPLAALDAIEQATGEREVHAVGYCVGGTLLAIALAYMASKRDRRIRSATLFAAQVDFTYSGDLKVFADEDSIKSLERRMAERGYLD